MEQAQIAFQQKLEQEYEELRRSKDFIDVAEMPATAQQALLESTYRDIQAMDPDADQVALLAKHPGPLRRICELRVYDAPETTLTTRQAMDNLEQRILHLQLDDRLESELKEMAAEWGALEGSRRFAELERMACAYQMKDALRHGGFDTPEICRVLLAIEKPLALLRDQHFHRVQIVGNEAKYKEVVTEIMTDAGLLGPGATGQAMSL